MDRRTFLKAGLAAGALPLFGTAAHAAKADLRLYWWGSQDRAKRTLAVADLFKAKYPEWNAAGETVGADYWPKLSTMLVGRNLPDVLQFEPNTIGDYTRRGATLDLGPYLGKTIKTDRLDRGVLDLARIDGKVTGLALGLNAFSLFYDADAFAAAGLQPPQAGITWAEYAKLAVEIGKATGKPNLWGTTNASRYTYVFDAWLHQRDKLLFNAEGKLGFTVEDAKEWYAYWEELRKAGGCVAADVQAGDTNQLDSNPLARGNALMAFTFSNQLVGYQSVLKQKIGISQLPLSAKNGKSGLFLRPALIFSVGKTTANPEAAAAFIDFFINDVEAGKILGVERGVPVNLDVRAAVGPTLEDVPRAAISYIDAISPAAQPYPPTPPEGSLEFDTGVMRPIADQLSFGKISVDEAAKRLVAEGRRVIRA